MHIAEIVTNSKREANSFLAGVEFCDDTTHSPVGVRRDGDDAAAGKWLAVVVNHDAGEENALDEEISASGGDPVEQYLVKYPDAERYEP